MPPACTLVSISFALRERKQAAATQASKQAPRATAASSFEALPVAGLPLELFTALFFVLPSSCSLPGLVPQDISKAWKGRPVVKGLSPHTLRWESPPHWLLLPLGQPHRTSVLARHADQPGQILGVLRPLESDAVPVYLLCLSFSLPFIANHSLIGNDDLSLPKGASSHFFPRLPSGRVCSHSTSTISIIQPPPASYPS